MIRKVYLHGKLGKQFGPVHELDVSSPAQAVSAFVANYKEFRAVMTNGVYNVIVGKEEAGRSLGEEQVSFPVEEGKEIHFIPVLGGSGGDSGGVLKAVAGVALIVAGIFIPGAQGLVSVGAGLLLSGIATMIAPSPRASLNSYSEREDPSERNSFLFSGARNTSEQGQPMPIVYGRFQVGSIVLSLGLTSDEFVDSTGQPLNSGTK